MKTETKDFTPYWKRRDPVRYREIRRKHELKKKYGITPEQWEELYQRQCGLCATCFVCLTYSDNICVDHCHKTQKVRGLLCSKCNKALGLIHDDIETLEEMISYLKSNK